MKKLVSLLMIVSLLFLINCGNDKEIAVLDKATGQAETKTFLQYGLFDKEEVRDERIQYKVIVGNVIWSILLFETVVAPVIIFGWYLYEPIDTK